MTYSQIIIEMVEDWLNAMKSWDNYQLNKNINDINVWYKHLDIRKESYKPLFFLNHKRLLLRSSLIS